VKSEKRKMIQIMEITIGNDESDVDGGELVQQGIKIEKTSVAMKENDV
jgi:hypothetical protein